MKEILDKATKNRRLKKQSGSGILVLGLAQCKIRAHTEKLGGDFDTVNIEPR